MAGKNGPAEIIKNSIATQATIPLGALSGRTFLDLVLGRTVRTGHTLRPAALPEMLEAPFIIR